MWALLTAAPGMFEVAAGQSTDITLLRQWLPATSHGGPAAIAISGNYAYSAGDPGVEVYDLTDPSTPALVGATELIRYGYAVLVASNRLYVAGGYSDGSGRLEI